MVFADDINKYRLVDLREQRPKAYTAIQDKNERKALVLTGLFQLSKSKGYPKHFELEYSDDAIRTKENDIFRFRQIFVGNEVGINPRPMDWNFELSSIRLAKFDSLNYVQEFIETLFLFLALCEDGKPAWRSIMTPPDNQVMKWRSHQPNAFKNICENVLGKVMQPNKEKIKGLIYSSSAS
jgi:hypothetical protein